jgi:hypothetical protein
MVLRSPWPPRILLASSLLILCAALVLANLAATKGTPDPNEVRILGWLLAAGLVWLALGVLRMGYVRIDDDAIEIRTSMRTRRIARIDIARVTLERQLLFYVRVAPALELRTGKSVRLSDFASPASSHHRHPTTSVPGRAAAAIAGWLASDTAERQTPAAS